MESGTHSELLRKKGSYNDLVVMQTIAGLEIDEEEICSSADEEGIIFITVEWLF